MIAKKETILITGAHGFVGRSVVHKLLEDGYQNLVTPTRDQIDLTSQQEVKNLFTNSNPSAVIHLAGKVGGINANRNSLGEFFYDNITMGTFVLEHARRSNVKKLVGLAAGCGYPSNTVAPFKEEDFWNGLPDDNSYGYSMAKKNLIIQSWAYREQFRFDSTILIPANIYGPHDHFSLENSHVVPGLIRKFVFATLNNEPSVEVWGSGLASREFIYVNDVTEAICRAINVPDIIGPLNLGTGVETTIQELVLVIANIVKYHGTVVWNNRYPDGQKRRFYDMTKFKEAYNYIPPTSLQSGLEKTISWFKENINNFRE